MARSEPRARPRALVVTAVATAAVITLALAVTWPHNYDEGFNYFYFADRGFRFVATDYAYPNNHVLFTLIQALIPLRAIEVEPLLLRLPNILYSAALVGVLTVAAGVKWSTPLRAVALIFAGPLTLQFYAQARGFQLGTLLAGTALLVAARFPDRRWSASMSALLAAAATYTIPTFALGVPALPVYFLVTRRWRAATEFTALYGLVTLVLYLPLLDQVVSDRTNSFSRFRPLGDYSRDLLGNSFFLPVALAVVLLALAGWAWLRAAGRLPSDGEEATTFLFIGFPLLFMVLAEAIQLTEFAASPFIRNASFLAAFTLAGIWASPLLIRVPLLTWLVGALVLANVFFGLAFHFDITGGSGIRDYRGTFIGQTPRLSPLLDDELQVEAVRCAWTDQWTCRLYERRFAEHEIDMEYPVTDITATDCLVGTHPPQAETGIEVVLADGTRRLVCY